MVLMMVVVMVDKCLLEKDDYHVSNGTASDHDDDDGGGRLLADVRMGSGKLVGSVAGTVRLPRSQLSDQPAVAVDDDHEWKHCRKFLIPKLPFFLLLALLKL
ncbi:hypothetical protein CDL15_Pgr027451 [Punica granatum]|uniref:Uncharacterized protein n=1 Tax=Punica granatum TaxID=22663 RepID=A0A218XIC1_PUNGR|nr:hypothetical protein CDL15_Pgr027451 [Punica granatum]